MKTMIQLKNILNRNLIDNNLFSILFIILGCITQFLVFDISNIISLISGISGVICVVLVSRKKMSQFLFGFIQLFTYIYISYKEHLWGEVGITMFFIIMMIIALFTWSKNSDGKTIYTKYLTHTYTFLTISLTVAGIFILYNILRRSDDPQPFIDSLTTVPAVTAQILMTFRYKEQWIYWFIIDIAAIYMWWIAGDYNMVMQYIFWALNCIYGWILWCRK